jgi:hypothetical protein
VVSLKIGGGWLHELILEEVLVFFLLMVFELRVFIGDGGGWLGKG